MDLIYLAIVVIFFLLSGWLISALERLLGDMTMNVMYVLGGILSLGLLVYLMVALLKPEWF